MSTDRQMLERRVRLLERENQHLQQVMATRQRMLNAGAAVSEQVIQIIDGATVYSSGGTTYYGITRKSGTMTQVASLWDPTGDPTPGAFTAETGIGRGTLYTNGVSQGVVLVVHDTRAGNLIAQALANGDVVGTFTSTILTLASDPTQSVLAYCPTYL